MVHGPGRVASVFGDYFEDVYTANVSSTEVELKDFLDQYSLPVLSTGGQMILNAHLTLEELTEAVASMANSKCPGTDGLPAEVYKRYSEPPSPLRYYECRSLIWKSPSIYERGSHSGYTQAW